MIRDNIQNSEMHAEALYYIREPESSDARVLQNMSKMLLSHSYTHKHTERLESSNRREILEDLDSNTLKLTQNNSSLE
jgi:hypothetical protein